MFSSHKLAIAVSLIIALALPAVAFADVGVGDKPAYTATTIDGETVTAEELRGKVVLVDFWATWCKPCKDSFPFYSKLVDEHDGELVVLAVSVDGKAELVRSFLADKDFALTVVWHKDHLLARTFGPSMFPTSYLIDKEGVVRHIDTGFDKEVRAKTSAQIEALVAQ
jgi:thiol-disulfide isomerase/thioredoxin